MWIADPTAAMLAASRRHDEQATGPEHSPAFKAKVALAAVKGEKTLARGGGGGRQQCDVHPKLINQWRARLPEGAADVFGAKPAAASRRST